MADSLLTPPSVIPPRLNPLAQSHEADDLEAQLQSAFIDVFEATLRAAERRVNSYGTPHRGSFETIERFVKADGLAIERKTDKEPFMAELFRGWRAQNPRRGTAFLRYYLQLLWPGQWTLAQLWQDPGRTYPAGGMLGEQPGWFLTSRLQLTLDMEDPIALASLLGSFKSVLPARMVLTATLRTNFESPLRMAAVMVAGERQEFAGTAAV